MMTHIICVYWHTRWRQGARLMHSHFNHSIIKIYCDALQGSFWRGSSNHTSKKETYNPNKQVGRKQRWQKEVGSHPPTAIAQENSRILVENNITKDSSPPLLLSCDFLPLNNFGTLVSVCPRPISYAFQWFLWGVSRVVEVRGPPCGVYMGSVTKLRSPGLFIHQTFSLLNHLTSQLFKLFLK